MRKILVTGAGGFVGARILDQWRGRYELCTFPHGFSADSDEAAVRALIAREKPDVIVHTAALSNTAYCASHPEESLRANVLLPEWIAKAAAETGAKLLAFSSDQVYAGCKESGPLSETLSLSPAMSMAATSWKPNSGCLPSTRTPYCCGQPGCMISRAIGSLSGATCR